MRWHCAGTSDFTTVRLGLGGWRSGTGPTTSWPRLASDRLDAIYLPGGSSSLRPFQQLLRQRAPGTEVVEGDLFGAAASSLVYVCERR